MSPPGRPETRERILAAAKPLFAAHGFKGATIRAIAADAGVDPALVMHYFGSKSGLFDACMNMAFDPNDWVPDLVAGEPDLLGERLAWGWVRGNRDPETSQAEQTLYRSMRVDDDAEQLAREIFEGKWTRALSDRLNVDPRRVQLAQMHIMGVTLGRYFLRLQPLASMTDQELVDHLAPTLQALLDPRVPFPPDPARQN